MKIKEVRDKSKDELEQELRELNAELFNLRSKKITGQLDKPHKFKEIKKTIARIKTIFAEQRGSASEVKESKSLKKASTRERK